MQQRAYLSENKGDRGRPFESECREGEVGEGSSRLGMLRASCGTILYSKLQVKEMASIGQKLKLNERLETTSSAHHIDAGEDIRLMTRVLSHLKGDSVWAFTDQGIASLG